VAHSKKIQAELDGPKPFRLTHLGNKNQAIVALGDVLRAMANGKLSADLGTRLCNGLGILIRAYEVSRWQEIEEAVRWLEAQMPQQGQPRDLSPPLDLLPAPPVRGDLQ
jgi:hypothetical protein